MVGDILLRLLLEIALGHPCLGKMLELGGERALEIGALALLEPPVDPDNVDQVADIALFEYQPTVEKGLGGVQLRMPRDEIWNPGVGEADRHGIDRGIGRAVGLHLSVGVLDRELPPLEQPPDELVEQPHIPPTLNPLPASA